MPSRLAPIFLAALLVACTGTDGDPGPSCPADVPSPAPTGPYAQDPELAERIPDEVGGESLEVQTVCATLIDSGGLTTSEQMLDEVGVTRQEVTIALTQSPGGETGPPVGITAWRYAGAREEAIREAFVNLLQEAEIPVEEETIAGKQVHQALFHTYYVAGDTLYSVLGEDEPVAEALEALP